MARPDGPPLPRRRPTAAAARSLLLLLLLSAGCAPSKPTSSPDGAGAGDDTAGAPDDLLAERLALTIAGRARRLGL
jgi:hypothetical protein